MVNDSSKGVFLFNNDGNIEKHSLLTGIEDKEHYNKLIDNGDAVKIDLGEYGASRDKAKQVHNRFVNDVERIREDDNPAMTSSVKEYEIAKLEAKYVEDSEALQEEYSEWRKERIEVAKSRVATATTQISEADKQVAEQFATRASLKLATEDEGVALMQIREDIAFLSDEQKTALQSSILSLVNNVNNQSDKRAILDAVGDVRSPDLLAHKIASQLPANPAIDYTRRRAVSKVNLNSFGSGGK